MIRIAIAGVGNCASSLVQGISYYTAHPDDHTGLAHPDLGGYRITDIDVAAAFDIDARKIGKPLHEAIFAPPNNTTAGFSTNFRREAGAAGKDTRGMFRVHQFNKVEMFVYTTPDESWAEHERLVELEEAFLQKLGLPYRAVNVAAGDLGAPAAKKIDLEAWFPSQQRYREITSCSNTTDYQARRLGIRYRADGSLQPVHTLNGTMVTDRGLLSVLENFGGEVPDALRPYGAPARVTA